MNIPGLSELTKHLEKLEDLDLEEMVGVQREILDELKETNRLLTQLVNK